MTILKPDGIKTGAEFVTRQVKNVSEQIRSNNTNNPAAVIDNLNSMARSAAVSVHLPAISPKHLLIKHSDFFQNSEYGNGVKEFIQSLDNNAKELYDIDDLINLVKKEKLSEKIFNGFSKDSKISECISEDLSKIRRGNKSIADIFVPELKTEMEAVKNTKAGDVFQISGEKNIRIKTAEGGLEPLKMDKETYLRLFPPVTRYANIQNGLGNCYEITALNSLMQNPKTRPAFLKCFEQKGNDIVINFPNGSIKDGIKIAGGKLPEYENKRHYSIGSEGFRLIEYALGKDLKNEFLNYHISRLEKSTLTEDKFKLAKLKKVMKKDDSKAIAKLFGADNQRSTETNLREGNFATVVWSKFGFKENCFIYTKEIPEETNFSREIDDWHFLEKHFSGKDITDESLFMDKIFNPEFFKNHLVECSVLSKDTMSQFPSGHSLRLSPVLDKKGDIESYLITDPYHITGTKVPFEEILNNIDTLTFAKI